MMAEKDVVIIGGGIAGLTAALYTQRAGHDCVVIEKNVCGGQIVQSGEVENYPGIKSTDGPSIAMTLWEQATAQGAEVIFDAAVSLELDEEIDKKMVLLSNGEVIYAKTVIWAGGAKHRKLGCKGEDEFSGRGVSYCATCDGAFYRGKTAAIVGGGNTALEDALFLSRICEKVYLIHRRDTFRGEAVLAEAVKKQENIELILNANVTEITGDKKVSGARIALGDGSEREIEISGIFIAVGVVPDTEMLRGLVELDEAGYVVAGEDCKTNVDGIFVAGDCRTKALRQLVTAACDGANAATNACALCR